MVKRHGVFAVLIALTVACSQLPANRECRFVEEQLANSDGVGWFEAKCAPRGVFAGDGVSATIEVDQKKTISFERLGYNAFGANATHVVVVEAVGLVPRVASCDGVGPPNFHRVAPLGHHFHPTLIDVKDALSRAGDVLEEVQYWPRCPMSWDVQDSRGVNYRYCTRKKGDTADPPPPEGCAPR